MLDSSEKQPIQLDEATRQELVSKDLVGSCVKIHGKEYSLETVLGSGFKGVVWKGKDEYGAPVAIKFAITADYQDRSFLQEATLAKMLRGYQRFAQCIDADVVELALAGGLRKFVGFAEEWVDGNTLDEYLRKAPKISSSFLIEFVKMICEALSNLKHFGLCHDDLRGSNIKIAPPKPGSLETYETEVKIIDTVSLKKAPSRKAIDDHHWFVRHIIDIRNEIYKRKALSKTDRSFMQAIIPLLDKMLDEDQAVALTDPSKIAQQFEATWKECGRSIEEREQKLEDPFHYISAETISDKLLVDLFAESCPWKDHVLSPDPIVLTGPRGCGKSTIFRRMSLKGMLIKGAEEVNGSSIAGFYISCTTDLRNHINWIKSENLARKFRGEILHYFNLLVTREVVATFIIIALRQDKENLFGFSSTVEKKFYKFLVNKLMITEFDRMRLQGVTPMAHAFELVETEMEKCHEAMIRGLSLAQRTPASYISDLTSFLSQNVPYLSHRRIVFFIDDLSTRQIPNVVQIVMNDVLLERAKNHTFKISSDKYGWTGFDSLAAVGEKTREFKEVDCGKFFLVDAESETKKQFARELLGKRLRLAGYSGTPEEIIGKSAYPEGSLGKAIRARKEKEERVNDVYYGLETITALCCGDISVLLEIYRRIFSKGKVDSKSHLTVDTNKQHEAIVSISRELYNYIKSYHPFGDEMFAIVTHFGTLSRRILREGRLIRQKNGLVIPETSRIEVDEDPSQPQIDFTSLQKEIMTELVRRAIFIELDPGSARRGSTPSLRWQLRPVLCPTFLTTPFKTFAIKWTPEQFRFFLTAPEDICNHQFAKLKAEAPIGFEEKGPTLLDFNKEGSRQE